MKSLRKFYNTTIANNPTYRSVAGIVLVTAFILLIPLVAMQVTDEVDWDETDFTVAGALMLGTGLTYMLAVRKSVNVAYRLAVGVALAAAFLLVGINLAVGIIGAEDNPANMMYFGVLAVGFFGAIIARFKPRGMAYALFATALTHALVVVIVLIIGMHLALYSSVGKILGPNGFFLLLWIGSAWLFRKAAREQTPA